MKQTILKSLALVLTMFLSSPVLAVGTGDSGGGGDLKADFIKRAEILIRRLRQSAEPEASRYATLLERTLARPGFKIEVVETLIDPLTQKSVANQRPLYAYGAPNWIQLKSESKTDPEAASWSAKVAGHKNLDVDVFHEMAWAAGLNEDRDYHVSIGKLKLHIQKGIQRARLGLLKQDRYYKLPQYKLANCLYHVEVDLDASTFVITPFEIPRPDRLTDCNGGGFANGRFSYDENRDVWVQTSPASSSPGTVEILPDGNYVFKDGATSPSWKTESDWKAMAMDPKAPVPVEDVSNSIGGYCAPLHFAENAEPGQEWLISGTDKGLDQIRRDFMNDAFYKAQTKCKELFKTCNYKRTYDHQYTFRSAYYCNLVAVFEGTEPRL